MVFTQSLGRFHRGAGLFVMACPRSAAWAGKAHIFAARGRLGAVRVRYARQKKPRWGRRGFRTGDPPGGGEDDRPIHFNSDQSPAVPRRGASPLTPSLLVSTKYRCHRFCHLQMSLRLGRAAGGRGTRRGSRPPSRNARCPMRPRRPMHRKSLRPCRRQSVGRAPAASTSQERVEESCMERSWNLPPHICHERALATGFSAGCAAQPGGTR